MFKLAWLKELIPCNDSLCEPVRFVRVKHLGSSLHTDLPSL
jgi:hypothetical protein